MKPLKFLAVCATYSAVVVKLAPWFGEVAYRIDRHFADRLNPEDEQ